MSSAGRTSFNAPKYTISLPFPVHLWPSHMVSGPRAAHLAGVWYMCTVLGRHHLEKDFCWTGPVMWGPHRSCPDDWSIPRPSEIISAAWFHTLQVSRTCAQSSPIAHALFTQLQTFRLYSFSPSSRNLFIWPSISLSLFVPLQFKAALHRHVLSIPAGSCSAAPVDLQLLSNTYCQASETCNLSFARYRPANSIHYINKKNDWCYTRQELVFISLRARETAGLRDT